MGTQYVVDFVLGVMKSLSLSEPVLFQRNGALFVASEAGFGYVTPGLRMIPEEIREWEKREQPREIIESAELPIKYVKEDGVTVRQKIKGEESYLSAICFGPDSETFSLKDISATVERLAKLRDDGKIRMVSHDSRYHSHKYGYASDGTDVWLTAARVMDKKLYLDIMRQREDEMLEKLDGLKINDREMRSEDIYAKASIPRGIILTPNIQVCLPVREKITARFDQETWAEKSELQEERRKELPSTYHESPYGITLSLNVVHTLSQTTEEYRAMRTQTIGNLDRELQAVEAHMAIAEGVIGRMNQIHNAVGAKNIASMSRIRKPLKKDKSPTQIDLLPI